MKPPFGAHINRDCTICDQYDIPPLIVQEHQPDGVRSVIRFRVDGHGYEARHLRHIALHLDEIGEPHAD